MSLLGIGGGRFLPKNCVSEGARVLIVDDEPADRILLAEMVRLQGYQPLVASGGAEALVLIQQNAVDVVLLDIRMPGMSGLEVLEQLAAQGLTPALPVVMVSALPDHKSRLAALDLGATDFLRKPIDRQELAARLRLVIQLKRLHDQVKSRLRDSENRCHSLMAGAAVPIMVLDLSGRVVEANAAAQSLYEPEFGPLVGQSYSSRVVAKDGPCADQSFATLVETGVPVLGLPLRVFGRGGREVHLDVAASRVETEQGRLILVVCRDVTQERRAQRQLAEREEELRRAQRVARVGSIRLLDPATGSSSWSEETFRLLGLPEDTTPGFQSYMARVHPDDRPIVARLREQGLQGGAVDFEHRVVSPGGWRWLHVRGEAQVDSQGSSVLVATIQDVTKLKVAELAREESLRFSQEVLDSLISRVAIVDEEGLIVATNRAWRDFALAVGGTLESMAEGTNYLAICEATPEGLEVARCIRQALAGQPTPDEIEYECSSPSHHQWYCAQISRLSREGPGRVAIAHHEVTRLKLAEASAAQRARRLDLLTAHLPLVLWEDELRGGMPVCRWVSENVERVLGVSAESIINNNNWLSYVHPDDRASLVRPLRIETAHPWLEEYRWCRPDGSVVYLQTGVSSEQADGAGLVIGFALDVSESRKLAAVLLQAQKMEAIGKITGGIAHDFNNLLTVIRSFASFVQDELPEGDARRDDLSEVLAASDKAIALNRQLLSFSRPQVSASRPLDLNHTLAGVLKMLQRCVGESIAVQLAASARPAIVRLDPVHLDQLMMNLAVNARDAMPEGGRLNLSISHPSEGGDSPSGRRVRLLVRDTGSGMEPDTLARIFDPFFTTKEVGKGTGLGLATCYGLVKEAGGTISVESVLGAGTAFTIDFPVCDEPLEESLESELAGLQAVRDRLVLVVEDDHPLRKVAVRILESAGYRVSQARDGDEAIQRIDELGHALDLIFTDVVLPGRGGYAVAEYARSHAPGLVVVLTSGYMDRQVAAPDRAHDLPLLWKPYTAASLLRAVDSALLEGRRKEADPFTDPLAGRLPAEPLSSDCTPALLSAGAILLVEDDGVQREVYARALRSSGFGVTAAESGEEAVGLLERLSFDAVASDIGLPGMDGLAVLSAARALDPELPTLLMTATPSVETAATAVNSRAFGYLVKPIPLEVLVQEVRRAVEAGQVARLQRKLLAARAGADEFLLDLPATRRSLDAALRRLHVVFQPIVRSHDGSIFGFEALLRSDEPTLDTPLKVIAAADVLGRTDEVGLAVRSAIAATLAQHPEQMEAIFVNLHPGELRSQLLCAVTEPLLRRAAKVVLEVTERASLSVGPETNEEVRRLRQAGYRLAIDDLGESHAGLSWMSHLRPDIAKIDMSLVRGAPQSPLKREILASLINVCRRAAITVVAEGLETEEEVRLLTDLGCDLLQGYYFSRPGPAFPAVRQLIS